MAEWQGWVSVGFMNGEDPARVVPHAEWFIQAKQGGVTGASNAPLPPHHHQHCFVFQKMQWHTHAPPAIRYASGVMFQGDASFGWGMYCAFVTKWIREAASSLFVKQFPGLQYLSPEWEYGNNIWQPFWWARSYGRVNCHCFFFVCLFF